MLAQPTSTSVKQKDVATQNQMTKKRSALGNISTNFNRIRIELKRTKANFTELFFFNFFKFYLETD